MKLPQIPTCSREEWLRNIVLTNEEAVRITLPAPWQEVRLFPPDHPLYGLRAYQKGGLKVLFCVDGDIGGKRWIHVSMSRRDKIPNYGDMVEVKKLFIGDDRQAIQVFPVKEKHVNFHPYCLHLWCCLDGDGLPDFGKDGII